MVTVAHRAPVDGDALKQARIRAGLSQALLSQRAELTIRTISLAENGRASHKTLQRLAAVLRVPVEALHAPAPQPAAQAQE